MRRDEERKPVKLRVIAKWTTLFVGLVLLLSVLGFATCAGVRSFGVWSKGKAGEATLAEQEWAKKVAIEEAKAEMESAKLKAQAEIERAKGVAEANRIIADSLKGNEVYLRYLWVNGLHDGSSEVIYVPTEAQLPILEAGKRVIAEHPGK